MRKQQRWYAVDNGTAYIYDQPHPERSVSVSIVPESELKYYRQTFKLEKVWTK